MPPTFRILDVVALTSDVPTAGLVRGQVGTVIERLGPETWEVEFIANNGRTYALVPLAWEQLLVLRHGPVGAT